MRVISYQTTIAKEQEYVRYCYDKRFFKWDFEAHGVFSSSEFSSLARLQTDIVATWIKTGEKSFCPPLDPINKSLGKIKKSKTKHNIMDGQLDFLRMSFVYFDFFVPHQQAKGLHCS